MSASGRTPAQPIYHQQPGFIPGHHWPQGREVVTETSRRRHPSDSPATHVQHVPSYHQWSHTSAASRNSSTSSVSSYSQQSFSNPRSPTGSCYSEGDVFPPPPDYSHSLVDGYYRKPLPPTPVSVSVHPAQWHDARRSRWSSASVNMPYNHHRSDSFNEPYMQQVDRERYVATLPHVQQNAAERNIYERICDVQYGAAQPGALQPSRGGMELHRAPSVQSISSTGSGSVRSAVMIDYPRQWAPDRRAGSRDNVSGPPPYSHPPSHPHSRPPNYAHYRQGSTDSGSQHRGDSGNHGNQSTYYSPDSGDSGFLSHPSSEVDTRVSGNGPIYSEIGRLAPQRPAFSRAQTVPSVMWPEGSDGERNTLSLDKSWFVEDDVDAGYANSTIPNVERAPVAGKPNGRYFPSTPEQDNDAKKAPSRSKSNTVEMPSSPSMARSKSGPLNKLSRKLSAKKKHSHEDERSPPQEVTRIHRSNSLSCPAEKESRRAQSMEYLNEPKRNSMMLTTNEGSRTVAAVLTPKMFRNPKLKKVSDGDTNSLSGSLSNLLRGDKASKKGNQSGGGGDTLESLFLAILNHDLTKVQFLLESLEAGDLNSHNEDGFTPLDLAIMSDNPAISRLLQSHGARDSQQYFRDPSVRLSTLSSLVNECEHEITLLMLQAQQAGGYTTSSVAKELGKRLQHWEWRRFYFKQMKQLCSSASPPSRPKDVRLTVSSSHKLSVTFSEPDGDRSSGNIITRYRVEWSQHADFSELAGERTMTDVKTLEYTIPDLKQGQRYYVRVSAFNLAGFGETASSVPIYAIPSSWHDIDSSKPRYEGSFNSILSLGSKTKSFYTQNAAAVVLTEASSSPSSNAARQKSIKKGITKFFGSVIKYHKTLKSGLYLALLLYSTEDRVLVTVDDNLPIVEVGDEYSRSTLGADISWLNKVLCASDLVKALREWSANCTSSPNIQFRHKLLSVVGDLQLATGVQDLGLLYPLPYFDGGTTVLVIVNSLDQPRSSQGQSLKWTTVNKLCRKKSSGQIPASVLQVGGPITDRLALDTQELIWYHQKSREALPRGLYLGYYQAMSTVGYLKMLAAKDHPNVIPHCKIRDCPNVSREEWEWLQSLQSVGSKLTPPSDGSKVAPPSELVKVFQDQLRDTIAEFLQELDLPQKDQDSLRLYTCEVVELNEDVSFLVVMPPPERVCMPPGSEDAMREIGNAITMPLPLFEIIQYQTYQQAFLKLYAQLSARLELELAIAQHKRRQAFTKQEMSLATEAYASVETFHMSLDSLWHCVTWIDDAVRKGRDTQTTNGIPLTLLLAPPPRAAPPPPPTTSPPPLPKPSSNFIKVQPLYNTGLAVGTTVKLNCSQSTVAREVIRLTVLQLDKARRQKGKPGPALTEKDLSDFYMIAVCGDQESILAEDICVTEVQQRWPNCNLFLHRHSEDSFVTEHGPCTSV